MDTQRNSLLNWAYYYQGKTVEELKQSLLYTSVELEQTRMVVQEELKKRDDQLLYLKDLLTKTIRERDEATHQCETLLFEKLLHLQQQPLQQKQAPPVSGISSVDDEHQQQQQQQQQLTKGIIEHNNGVYSSDCEESIVSSPVLEEITAKIELVASEKPLPEKGKLLQAVREAGPLLQTLLLAGPLPQWRHPPPPLESFEIPPVTILPPQPPQPPQPQDSLLNNFGKVNKKRVLIDGSNNSPIGAKYQRIILN